MIVSFVKVPKTCFSKALSQHEFHVKLTHHHICLYKSTKLLGQLSLLPSIGKLSREHVFKFILGEFCISRMFVTAYHQFKASPVKNSCGKSTRYSSSIFKVSNFL